MKYMFLLYGAELVEPGTPEARKLLEEWSKAHQAMAEAGVLIDCAPLQPRPRPPRCGSADGETLLTDGPAAEIKEQFGGLHPGRVRGLDEALKWAARFPTALDGSVEVRPGGGRAGSR